MYGNMMQLPNAALFHRLTRRERGYISLVSRNQFICYKSLQLHNEGLLNDYTLLIQLCHHPVNVSVKQLKMQQFKRPSFIVFPVNINLSNCTNLSYRFTWKLLDNSKGQSVHKFLIYNNKKKIPTSIHFLFLIALMGSYRSPLEENIRKKKHFKISQEF